jgi:hypothetical protein
MTLILLAGTIEFVHIEQISALYKFHSTTILGDVWHVVGWKGARGSIVD